MAQTVLTQTGWRGTHKTFEIEGALELGKLLDAFSDKIRGRLIRHVLRKMAEIVYHAARHNASRGHPRFPKEVTGNLVDSIRIKTFWNKMTGTLGASIGTGSGHLFKGAAFYAGFVEFGHRLGKRIRDIERPIERIRRARRAHGRGGLTADETKMLRAELNDPRAEIKAYPFLRPAWDENLARIRGVLFSEMKKGIEREARKAAREAGVKTA